MPAAKRPTARGVTATSGPAITTQNTQYTIYDWDTAITQWTTLINTTLPAVDSNVNYLKGLFDRL